MTPEQNILQLTIEVLVPSSETQKGIFEAS